MDPIQKQFMHLLQVHNIHLNDLQMNQFELYFKELISWNEKVNLTGITEREQVYYKHFYDSLSLSFFMPVSSLNSVADIGSGAGFPAIPLKIVYPHLKITLIDSINKRIRFLKHLTEILRLEDILCVHGRAEDIARQSDYRDQFDLVVARAVARLNVLNELCLPFVKVGGLFAAMKGTDPETEIQEAKYSLNRLHAKLNGTYALSLPSDGSNRHIIVCEKVAATPFSYPRKAGMPNKSPLISEY